MQSSQTTTADNDNVPFEARIDSVKTVASMVQAISSQAVR